MSASGADEVLFIKWLERQVVEEGRGDNAATFQNSPAGRFWLGRVASEEYVRNRGLGERGERIDPCEIGVRVRASGNGEIQCVASFCGWVRPDTESDWQKIGPLSVPVSLPRPTSVGDVVQAGQDEIRSATSKAGIPDITGEVRAELESGGQGIELVVTLVNTSGEPSSELDTNMYQAALRVEVTEAPPFLLDNLPDAFRYDRYVAAYGVNCGVQQLSDTAFETCDYVDASQPRPDYWDESTVGPQPDLSFSTLGDDPVPSLRSLVNAMRRWGGIHWSEGELARRCEDERWTDEMLDEARRCAAEFRDECERVSHGVDVLESDDCLLRAFRLMNRSFVRAPISHTDWRPFQVGFFLSSVSSLTDVAQRDIAEVLRFATGGGKTETYLGMLVTVAFFDRLRGKKSGVSGWARFPLRMLSLQQTQRFADVFAAAETIRRDEGIEGDPFRTGFLVGEAGTPNKILPDASRFDWRDAERLAACQVLIRCPLCGSEQLRMMFSQDRWCLEHVCKAEGCPSGGEPLPFIVVDQEIYRLLPTVVVGTLDKAASIALQAAMRGLYGAPRGRCPHEGHGFTYAPRQSSPTGCLFPGCTQSPGPLGQSPEMFVPTLMIQDELHLLRDSLGAVDTHYEALLDFLQQQAGTRAKVLASSATIKGYGEQVDALYQRKGRVFPAAGPRASLGFWQLDSGRVARRFVGLSPRGMTLDFATDRINETLQSAVRRALTEPQVVAEEAGVEVSALEDLVDWYGTTLVYGGTLKDVEAAARSLDTQLDVDPPANHVMMTGSTPLVEVRRVLGMLSDPPEAFADRVHVVVASQMMSHGVDVDRLNVMVMLGIPLSAAEFIQTTSRVGRRHSGVVFVLHKTIRERDAKVFAMFPQFVTHADRLVDPVPVTRRSRRVLKLTYPGLFQGLVYGLYEPSAMAKGIGKISTRNDLRNALLRMDVREPDVLQTLKELLHATGQLDAPIVDDLTEDVRVTFSRLYDPAVQARFVSDVLPGEPMLSLRDVEKTAPIRSGRGGRR